MCKGYIYARFVTVCLVILTEFLAPFFSIARAVYKIFLIIFVGGIFLCYPALPCCGILMEKFVVRTVQNKKGGTEKSVPPWVNNLSDLYRSVD